MGLKMWKHSQGCQTAKGYVYYFADLTCPSVSKFPNSCRPGVKLGLFFLNHLPSGGMITRDKNSTLDLYLQHLFEKAIPG